MIATCGGVWSGSAGADERVQVVGQAVGRSGVAGVVELVDDRLQSLLAVALAGGVQG